MLYVKPKFNNVSVPNLYKQTLGIPGLYEGDGDVAMYTNEGNGIKHLYVKEDFFTN